MCLGGKEGQETSLIHQDQSIKPQTDSIKGQNNYLCHNNITRQKNNTVSDTYPLAVWHAGKYLNIREQTEVQSQFFNSTFLLKTRRVGVPHGDCDFTDENVRQASSTENKCCSLRLISVENIFLNPNWSRMLIGFKLTLFSCQNTFKPFHAAQASCANMNDLPTGSINFHFIQEPCGRQRRTS